MTLLPARIPKKAKRQSRWRSQAHCGFVRLHECVVPSCGRRPIEVAHVRNGSGAGLGQKPDDWRAVSMCSFHHSQQHRLGEETFWREIANQDPEEVISEFIKASPRRAQIEREMLERNEDLANRVMP